MNRFRIQRWMWVSGIAACVLLIVAFPLIRHFMLRRRDTGKPLSLLDKFEMFMEHELDRRLGSLGVGLYRLTGGRIVRPWKVDALILTTRGRKSGKTRTVLLQFFRDGENLVIVAANGGRPSHPGWFFNLKATPIAQVQVMDHTLQVHAEEMSTEEATAFWPRILRVAPSYARYQQNTGRRIPLVRLVPVEQGGDLYVPGDEALSLSAHVR